MRFKVNDVVLAKGKIGVVTSAFPDLRRVVVKFNGKNGAPNRQASFKEEEVQPVRRPKK